MQTNEIQKVLDFCLQAGASDARIIHTISDQTAVSLYNMDIDKIHNSSDCSVFLQLFVKVDPDWRESRRELRKFGYEE